MPNPTVRISEKAHQALRDMAARTRQSMQEILDDAIEAERRRRFIEEANASYARLREDPKAWADHQEEIALWDVTLMDGLDPDERWDEPVPPRKRRRK